MIVTVFVNKRDTSLTLLGKALVRLHDRQYFVFTREPSEYPQCPIEKTMHKLKEIASHVQEDRIIVSFGCRVFPDSIKEIEGIASKKQGNIVLLKKLKGSKTWTEKNGLLTFENERIADCGIFILNTKDIITTTQLNFNSFIRSLLQTNTLQAEYVTFWVFSNNAAPKGH